MWNLKYKAEISLMYNEIMFKLITKFGGRLIHEIDIT